MLELTGPAPCLSHLEVRHSPQAATTVDWPVQVLLVEDNPEAACLVECYLSASEGEQFRVEWSQSLQNAMARLAQPGIEVILLDLGLPELSGYRSFCAIEAATGGKIPVVILTADNTVMSKDLTFGAFCYLVKDRINPGQLRQALHDAIRRGNRRVQ